LTRAGAGGNKGGRRKLMIDAMDKEFMMYIDGTIQQRKKKKKSCRNKQERGRRHAILGNRAK
jgi:hypothetical protein